VAWHLGLLNPPLGGWFGRCVTRTAFAYCCRALRSDQLDVSRVFDGQLERAVFVCAGIIFRLLGVTSETQSALTAENQFANQFASLGSHMLLKRYILFCSLPLYLKHIHVQQRVDAGIQSKRLQLDCSLTTAIRKSYFAMVAFRRTSHGKFMLVLPRSRHKNLTGYAKGDL